MQGSKRSRWEPLNSSLHTALPWNSLVKTKSLVKMRQDWSVCFSNLFLWVAWCIQDQAIVQKTSWNINYDSAVHCIRAKLITKGCLLSLSMVLIIERVFFFRSINKYFWGSPCFKAIKWTFHGKSIIWFAVFCLSLLVM